MADFQDLEQYLSRLENKIEEQAAGLFRLKMRNEGLEAEIKVLENLLQGREKKISDLEKQLQVINLAGYLRSHPQKEQLSAEIDRLIAQIDGCLRSVASVKRPEETDGKTFGKKKKK